MTVKLRGAIIKNGITIASLIIFNVVSRVFWTMYTLQKHLGKFSWFQQKLNSWRRSLSYRNQSIDLHSKSMDCGFYMIETSVMKDLSNFTDLLRLLPSQSSVPTPLDETHVDVVRGLIELRGFRPSASKSRARRSDAFTSDKDKQIYLVLMPGTWFNMEEFRLE